MSAEMPTFWKRPGESFPVMVDFSENMETDEIVTDYEVLAYDAGGEDVTSTLVASSDTYGTQGVQGMIQAGTDGQAYTLLFKCTTSATGNNKWEMEIEMRIAA